MHRTSRRDFFVVDGVVSVTKSVAGNLKTLRESAEAGGQRVRRNAAAEGADLPVGARRGGAAGAKRDGRRAAAGRCA